MPVECWSENVRELQEGVSGMTIQEAIRERHSVRRFTEKPIGEQEVSELRGLIDDANRESGLHIQLVLNEPESFNTLFAHYGRFANAVNYIAIVGPKDMPDLEEKACTVPESEMPEWFRIGVEAALLAPTAINQQKFTISMDEGGNAVIKAGRGPFSKVDLGIVKYNFEAASGHKCL